MPTVVDTSWSQAWSQALSALELDVERAESLLRAVHTGAALPAADDVLRSRWHPPTGLGPLPIPLADRAAAILRRQQEVTLRLAEAAHLNRRHAKAAVAHREQAPAVPVYLDVAM